MMFMPGPFELLMLLLVVGVPLLLVGRLLFGSLTGSSAERKSDRGSFSLGHATLTCPHCQQQTTASKSQCENCGEDL